jgi:hypothetical protein
MLGALVPAQVGLRDDPDQPVPFLDDMAALSVGEPEFYDLKEPYSPR